MLSVLLPTVWAIPLARAVTTAETIQTLDRIVVFGSHDVAEMPFDKAGVNDPLVYPIVATSAFQACKLTTLDGLFCLDGNSLRRWSNPAKSFVGDGGTLFDCGKVLDLTACTGMTVDEAGAIWLAGQNKRKTYNLVKVVGTSQVGNELHCPGSWAAVPGTAYSACSWATGRPLLVDITFVGGDEAAALSIEPGIFALEERKTVTYFPANGGAPSTIASGKSGWGLLGNEQLQSLALLTAPRLVAVTTSKARILSRSLATGQLLPAVCVQPGVGADPSGCAASASPAYAIRGSSRTGLAYVTDRELHQTLALDPQGGSGWQEVARLSTGPVAPEGPTIAAGLGIDLAQCSGECTLIEGATLRSVDLSTEKSGMTLFQVTGIPDCRWLPTIMPIASLPAACRRDHVIVNRAVDGTYSYGSPGVGDPAAQFLNVAPMLPNEITSLFDGSGVPPEGLPDLLISPQYRGQDCSEPLRCQARDGIVPASFYFEAFFGIVEPGVTFTGSFEAEFDVLRLAGANLGCTPASNSLPDLLKWDIVTKVSETHKSVDGKYVDTLLNTGCGSSKTSSSGWSLMPYNLEVTPDTVDAAGRVVGDNDAVFARLVQKLYGDLGYVTDHYACQAADTGSPGDNPPIAPGLCSTLLANWANGKDKLDKCLAATYQPKTSSGNQNCQAFLSQFTSFKGTLSTVGSYGPDPANRKGELDVRTQVIQHVFDTRFMPSVPVGGFCAEAGTCSSP